MSTLLKLLPPTYSAFEKHLIWEALSTMIDKGAQIPKPRINPCDNYGWTMDERIQSPNQPGHKKWNIHADALKDVTVWVGRGAFIARLVTAARGWQISAAMNDDYSDSDTLT
jgi:hypothetical protein